MTHAEITSLCTTLKSTVADIYAIRPQVVKLLKYSENITFLIESEDGNRYVLRVNRPGYHSLEELQGELLWMEDIRSSVDIMIPEVFANRIGDKISFLKNRKGEILFYSVFSFLEGHVLRELPAEELLSRIEDVGRTAAVLHKQAQNSLVAKTVKRFAWNFEDMIGERARWGNWEDNEQLSSGQKVLLRRAVTIMEKRLHIYGKSDDRYGLIHADLHLSNIMVHQRKLQLIDFDDCGYGWFLYECGCSLLEYNENLRKLAEAWLKGYNSIRFLSSTDNDEVFTFVLLRRILRLAWMQTHQETDTVRSISGAYIKKTANLAEIYINKKG